MGYQGKPLFESNDLNITNQRVVNLFGHPLIYHQLKEVVVNAYSQLQQLIGMFRAKPTSFRVAIDLQLEPFVPCKGVQRGRYASHESLDHLKWYSLKNSQASPHLGKAQELLLIYPQWISGVLEKPLTNL